MTDTIILSPRTPATVILSIVILPPDYVMTTDAGDPIITDSGGFVTPDRGNVVTDDYVQIISDDGRILTTDS